MLASKSRQPGAMAVATASKMAVRAGGAAAAWW